MTLLQVVQACGEVAVAALLLAIVEAVVPVHVHPEDGPVVLPIHLDLVVAVLGDDEGGEEQGHVPVYVSDSNTRPHEIGVADQLDVLVGPDALAGEVGPGGEQFVPRVEVGVVAVGGNPSVPTASK